ISQLEPGVASNGSLNLECAVLPPGNNVAAIPEDAVAMAISPLLLKVAIIAR
ncbi:hypothetical protein A2U01_0110610, partial [Trifolium medium]|nr:hypothetical protein [Trifolium medium]